MGSGCQGVGLEGLRGSIGGPTRGQGLDLLVPRESRGRPKGSKWVNLWAYRVQGGQWVGLQGPRG